MNPRNTLDDLGQRLDRVRESIPLLDYGVTIGDTRVTVSTALVALAVLLVIAPRFPSSPHVSSQRKGPS